MVVIQQESTDLEARLMAARGQLDGLIRGGTLGGAETLRESFPEVWANDESALELIFAEFVTRQDRGERQDRGQWYRRYPQWRERLERLFALFDLFSADGQAVEVPPGYDLLDVIGHGSSGVVYKARQKTLDRIVAIKVLWAVHADAALLQREAELAAKLEHANIVRVYEIGQWRGQPYLVMEYVGGGCLDPNKLSGSPADVAQIVAVLAGAVEHAHRHGIIHRDLKPANVLMQKAEVRRQKEEDRRKTAKGLGQREDGVLGVTSDFSLLPSNFLRIADFGLAVRFDSAEQIQRSMNLAGTPCYMAPEQAEARSADVGPRSDVYSLGAILYELLTGRPPFQGKSVVETLDLVRQTEPVPPRQIRPMIPRDLETIALKCMQKEPGRRYATAQALADDLRRFIEGRPIVARPVSTAERGSKWVRRHPAVTALGLALFAATATTIAALATKYQHAELARINETRLNQELQQSLAQNSMAAARALWKGGQLSAMRQTLDQCAPAWRDAEWRELDRLRSSHLQCWAGPEYAAGKLAASRDGKWLAVRRRLGTGKIDILDAANGENRGAIATKLPLHVEFSTDGRSLVVIQASGDTPNALVSLRDIMADNITRDAVVYDLETKKRTRSWRLPGRGGVLSRWGQRVASWDADVVRVWDCQTGNVVAELPEPAGPQRKAPQIAIDDNGRQLAIRLGSDDLHIWDIASKTQTASIPAGPSIVMGMTQFHSDGRLVYGHAGKPGASPIESTQRSLLHAWNLEGEPVAFAIPAPAPLVMATSPDGKFLAYIENRNIELFDARTGAKHATLIAHADRVLSIAFSSDSKRLYSGGADDTLRTWDISAWIK